jgi:hypothetical protein
VFEILEVGTGRQSRYGHMLLEIMGLGFMASSGHPAVPEVNAERGYVIVVAALKLGPGEW